MIIAVNTRLLIKNRKDGIARFADETLRRITQQHADIEFIFLFDRTFHPDFIYAENIIPKVVYPQARHPFLYDIWFNKRLPVILKKLNADLFLSPDGFLPLKCEIPTIAVMHDINFEHYPQYLPKKDLTYYKKRFPVFAARASHICTVSEFTKQDLIKTYQINADKISVIYNGISDCFQPVTQSEKNDFCAAFSQEQPYFVFTGSLHQRKNIARMLQAFDRLKAQHNVPHKFLIAGQKMWWTKEMQQTLDSLHYKEDIIFMGSLPDDQLSLLVAAAEAMIYVPVFEGFGIPPLEAMQCGVPVLASNTSSIPEVLGDAVLYADPFDVNNIAAGMAKILEKPRQEILIDKGFKQIKKYSWQKTADLLWESIKPFLK